MYSLVGMSTIKEGMGRVDEALEIEEQEEVEQDMRESPLKC